MSSFPVAADDASLLRTYAARGDAAAFAELVRRYADLVYATARRVTGSSAAAEDVSQDCFLSLATHSAAIRGSVAAWLHRASLNRSLEVIRSERARKQRESAAALATLAAAGAAAGDSMTSPAPGESAQLIAHVDEAIAMLPDELRVPLTEHFLCGRSQTELAGALGVSQSTISRRIDSGLERLRARLNRIGSAGGTLAVLPLLLSDAARAAAAAPPGVRAALTKIGLAGVRGSSAAGGMTALTKLAAALLLLVASVGGMVALAIWQTPPRPTRQVVVPLATPGTAASSADESGNKDDGDDDENHVDHDNDKHEDKDPQPR
jgi:RNA polymerase sigma factor (sigma-70 family)